jgi:hypothetical protein
VTDYTGPPIIEGDYQLEDFSWCQVAYLYGNELHKAGYPLEQAAEEGLMVSNALEPWGTPTPTIGRERSELLIHWPTLICAANAYASLPTERRLAAIDDMRSGTIPSVIMMSYGTGLCDRAALDDPEYDPAPPCVPQQVASGTILSVFAFTLTAGLTWLLTRKPFSKKGNAVH